MHFGDPVVQRQMLHFRIISDFGAEPFRRMAIGVDQCLAATQEEGVGAADRKRAGQRRLETHAVCLHPGIAVLGTPNHHSGQRLIGLAARDLHQVAEILVLAIGTGELSKGSGMHAAEISGVPGVSAPARLRRTFKELHRRTRLAR